jgi:hypothetical protein
MVLRRVGKLGGSSGVSGEVGEIGFFSSWSLFSNPSTRLRRASSTSVLGPRFLGTASLNVTKSTGESCDVEGTCLTYHKDMGTGRPYMPRSSVAYDYI